MVECDRNEDIRIEMQDITQNFEVLGPLHKIVNIGKRR